MDNAKHAANFIISLSVVTFGLVYLADLPTALTGETKLVTEYYYKNFAQSYFLDIVLVGGYILIGEAIKNSLELESWGEKLACIVLTTGVISSVFYILFSSGWQKGTFFSKWFAAVGLKAVLYDMILVSSVYGNMYLLDKLLLRRMG